MMKVDLAVIKAFCANLRGKISDSYVISFPKSGRTWLRAILSYYAIYRSNQSEHTYDFGRPILKTLDRRYVRLTFFHDIADVPYQDSLPYYELRTVFDARKYADHKNIFLLRNPRSILFSYYSHKKWRWPITSGNVLFDGTLDEFINSDVYGIKKIVEYLNIWAPILKTNSHYTVIHYEDMKKNVLNEMHRVLDHLGVDEDYDCLKKAVEDADFERMKKRELEKFEGRIQNNNEMKVRRGAIDSYKDELSREMLVYVEDYIMNNLDRYYDRYRYRTSFTPGS